MLAIDGSSGSGGGEAIQEGAQVDDLSRRLDTVSFGRMQACDQLTFAYISAALFLLGVRGGGERDGRGGSLATRKL